MGDNVYCIIVSALQTSQNVSFMLYKRGAVFTWRRLAKWILTLNPHNIAEFFVMQKYRRLGVGKFVAMRIFDMHRGGWEVSQWPNNIPARNFWEAEIREYTDGNFHSFGSTNEDHVGFTFYNN